MNLIMRLRLQFYISMGITGIGYLLFRIYTKLNDYSNPMFYLSILLLFTGVIFSIIDGKKFFEYLKSKENNGSSDKNNLRGGNNK